nr:hypothetical protein CFP56_78578 [Quercus suber]
MVEINNLVHLESRDTEGDALSMSHQWCHVVDNVMKSHGSSPTPHACRVPESAGDVHTRNPFHNSRPAHLKLIFVRGPNLKAPPGHTLRNLSPSAQRIFIHGQAFNQANHEVAKPVSFTASTESRNIASAKRPSQPSV